MLIKHRKVYNNFSLFQVGTRKTDNNKSTLQRNVVKTLCIGNVELHNKKLRSGIEKDESRKAITVTRLKF